MFSQDLLCILSATEHTEEPCTLPLFKASSEGSSIPARLLLLILLLLAPLRGGTCQQHPGKSNVHPMPHGHQGCWESPWAQDQPCSGWGNEDMRATGCTPWKASSEPSFCQDCFHLLTSSSETGISHRGKHCNSPCRSKLFCRLFCLWC